MLLSELMIRGIAVLFLLQILVIGHYSMRIGQIRSAAYIPGNFTDVDFYHGSCSECICYAFAFNESSIYQALNCYAYNQTCLLFKNFLSKSYIRSDPNSKLVFRSLPTNSTTAGCIEDYDQCGGYLWNGMTNCCTNSICVYINHSYSECSPSFSSPSTPLEVESSTTTTATVIHHESSLRATSNIFWSCCITGCASVYSADALNALRTCYHGIYQHATALIASTCDDGSTHMCTYQQPRNVSDILSYGFADVKITHQTETELCCICYSLRFMSGSIAGKEMIVQAISTGYASTSDNEFRLYVPGAGWTGTHHGCESLYGISVLWGDQTNGVRDRNDCETLPDDLHAGCYWRFDWFMNSDYLDVEATKVSCPSALTDITGCIRS